MLSAQSASQQLSQLTNSQSEDQLYHYISEKLVECDLNLVQGNHRNARTNLNKILRLLDNVKSADKDVRLHRVSVRCLRKLTICMVNLHKAEEADAEHILQQLSSSMRQLRTSIRQCDDTVDIVRGSCELARANLHLWQSARWEPLLTLDESIALLENTFTIGVSCGVCFLAREIFLHLGIAYESKQSVTQSLKCEADSLAWSAGYFFANVAGTTLVKNCELDACRIFSDNKVCGSSIGRSHTFVKARDVTDLRNESVADREEWSQRPFKTVHDYVQVTKRRLTHLPSSWLIISMTVDYNDNLIITRLTVSDELTFFIDYSAKPLL